MRTLEAQSCNNPLQRARPIQVRAIQAELQLLQTCKRAPLLNKPYPFQGPLWGKIDAPTDEPARRSAQASEFWPLLSAKQEMMGQDTLGHIMIPAQPSADLVVVHAQAIFTLLDGRLMGQSMPARLASSVTGVSTVAWAR